MDYMKEVNNKGGTASQGQPELGHLEKLAGFLEHYEEQLPKEAEKVPAPPGFSAEDILSDALFSVYSSVRNQIEREAEEAEAGLDVGAEEAEAGLDVGAEEAADLETERAFPDLADHKRAMGWFRAVLRNRGRDLARKKRPVNLETDDELVQRHAESKGIAPSTLELLEDEDTKAEVAKTIRRALTEVEAICVRLFYWTGMNSFEIAEVLGEPGAAGAAAVRKRLQRARSRLGAYFEERGGR